MRNDAERYDWNDPPETRRRLAADRIDADFTSLRVWQDANEDGISDAGELKTLAELGIASISVERIDVTGTNEGHDRGFAATFT